jgi:cell division protease FtsH
MNLDAKQREEITRKNAELEDIKPILKEEFRGIDNVIDEIIEAIRPFYIFPTSLKRPLVVNLWGLTGVGKTSVVNRIMDLLNLRHKYCKFDVGEYVHASSEYKLKFDLSDKVEKCTDRHLILAFDEFQLGRTINEQGSEIDRPSLRPIWDIIDSGIIHHFNRGANYCSEIAFKLKKCLDMGVVVEDGIVIENEEIYNSIFRSHYLRPVDFVNHPTFVPVAKDADDDDDDDEEEGEQPWYPLSSDDESYTNTLTGSERAFMYKTQYNNTANRHSYSKPYFIKYEMFNNLFNAAPAYFMEVNDYERWKNKFREGKDGDTLHGLVMSEFVQKTPLMQSENYSQSLIFCIGNIDEAYNMTHSSNPDADADLFHKHSLKISVPMMKEALSVRFRMEQIGRLGNNHIIYPALSKNTYEEIIERYLKQRMEDFETSFGMSMVPDKTIEEILYKEAVFPTQGARPILSTFNTLVDAYIARLVSDIIFNNPEATSIIWRYTPGDDPHYSFTTVSEEKSVEFTYPIKLTLENLRKSDYSEAQAHCAVHEAGHALVSILRMKLMPQEVKSKTASVSEGYCYVQMPDITTKELMYGDIMCCLGGLEAEKLIFGEKNMGTGGSSDLRRATTHAASMIKTYGMADHMHQISVPGLSPNAVYNPDANAAAEDWVIELVNKAQADTAKLLADNKQFLLELSHHLSIWPSINSEDLTAISQKYTTDIKSKDKYHGYKDMIKNQMLEMGMDYTEIPEEIISQGRTQQFTGETEDVLEEH